MRWWWLASTKISRHGWKPERGPCSRSTAAQSRCSTSPARSSLAPAAQYAAASGRFDGVVCLGAVIRGETDHYDHVCAAAARGIEAVGLATGVPCSFGVLTVDTYEQALARSGGDRRDSGAHAARAALSLAEIRAALASG